MSAAGHTYSVVERSDALRGADGAHFWNLVESCSDVLALYMAEMALPWSPL